MLFNSLGFIFLFLPVTLVGFFGLSRMAGREWSLGWLILCSGFFYAYWRPPYALLLAASIVFNFYTAAALQRLVDIDRRRARRLLLFRIVCNLVLIGYFKYSGFFASIANDALGLNWSISKHILPLGISFYTFTEIAYLVDIYQGKARPGAMRDYFLFVTFFPHLIAGPIVHYRNLIGQFRSAGRHRPMDLAIGSSLFVGGLFKKVILADGFARFSSPVFDEALPHGIALSLVPAWGAALAFTFQLYFDFSGYSDMAIGLARMVGIRFPVNFNSPYRSANIIDFWRRWHITLSELLREYLYIPLGGNRRGAVRRYINLFLTMIIGGLWHGAGWTFVVWGGLHGLYLIVNHLWRRIWRSGEQSGGGGRVASHVLTFISVVVGWVFFRARSCPDAVSLLAGMAGRNGVVVPRLLDRGGGILSEFLARIRVDVGALDLRYWGGTAELGWLALGCAIVFLTPNTQQLLNLDDTRDPRALSTWRPSRTWGVVTGVALAASLLSLVKNRTSEFLYFNF